MPKPTPEERKMISLAWPVSVVEAIDRAAKRQGRSRSSFIRRAVLTNLRELGEWSGNIYTARRKE